MLTPASADAFGRTGDLVVAHVVLGEMLEQYGEEIVLVPN
jgi:hypothetical protein